MSRFLVEDNGQLQTTTRPGSGQWPDFPVGDLRKGAKPQRRKEVGSFQFSVFSVQQKGELHLCVLCVLGGSILFFFLCAGTPNRNKTPANELSVSSGQRRGLVEATAVCFIA
jgi:hypothetical protein